MKSPSRLLDSFIHLSNYSQQTACTLCFLLSINNDKPASEAIHDAAIRAGGLYRPDSSLPDSKWHDDDNDDDKFR